ncbi:MAG: InlB B-repeat-containing protein [Paludibacteraceae bacterium]|nr:InlB B-repeat-containing protein [Paludibacteraceae bacterium]MBQ8705029.1 InlB B-repeat-containing protein [Paludibacteraceae bacterium]
MNTNQSIIARRYSLLCLVVGILFTLGIGNAWAHGGACTAKLEVKVGIGSGTVYASASENATSGDASVSADCGNSDSGTHTHTFYAFATPAAGNTFLGWTESATSTAGADASKRKAVTITSNSNGTVTKTLYAHFVEKAKVNITFVTPSNGTYTIKVNGGSAETVSSSDVVKNNVTDVTLTATPASGYAFAGWYKLNSAGEFVEDLSISSPYDASFTKSETIKMGARFVPTTLGKFILKGSSTEYYGLKAATVAAGGSGIIVPVAEETLVDGSDLMPFDNGTYTIKAGATLLVPYSSANEVQTKPKDIAYNSTGWTKALSIYKKLKLGEGVNINVLSGGVICVGGQLVSYNGGNPSAYPIGACGVIDMSSGGHIELNGTLYCWGFIKGQDMDQGNNTTAVGTITANNGAVIWEDFAVGDWRGGTACSTIASNASSWKFFPFQSYTIQNVEVPTTYKYGSTLSNYTNVYGGGGKNEGTFSLIGNSNTLFLLKDASSFVRKWYDPTTDLVNYELSGTAQLDALNVDAGITTVSSSSYNLPISSNMQIVLTNCNMTISKPMIVQPGAVIEIKNDVTLTLASNAYIFDVDNWGMYCNGRYFYSMDILTNHKNRGTGTSKELLDDATLIVDGTLNVTGKLYTTAGGADIMGNGGGSVQFSSLGGSGNIVMCTGVSTNENVAIAQANMHNEDDSYTQAEASTFYNVNSRWFITGKQNINSTTHVYDEFKFISSGAVSGTGGTTTTTPALYGEDKTGLVAGMKWCNVAQDATCNVEDATHSVIYNATQDLNGTAAANIRYTYQSSDWLQLLKTETEGVYGGSDNSLYAVEDCAVNSLGSVDENCLYTIDGVKKALVDGHFVALEKNANDEAFHNTANTEEYYISFAGCTWHPATKYAGEEKAYIVEGGDYIWYNNDWLLVEREDPFFFDYNDQNVKRYYEYENGEWILADPKVRVTDAIETRDFYFLPEAFAVANAKKNATITILKDITDTTTPLSYTQANTTCTLDLNGKTVNLTVTGSGTEGVNMIKIDASGSTFTITDNSAEKDGKLILKQGITTATATKRWYGIVLANGSLALNAGEVQAINDFTYTSTKNTGMISAIYIAAGKTFTMNGGSIYAESPYYPRAIEIAGSASANATVTLNAGTITANATTVTNAMGIYTVGGTTTIKDGVTINATTTTTSAYGIYVDASTSGYWGTVNMTGGTVNATATTTTALGAFVNGTYTFNNTTPNTIKGTYRAVLSISGGSFNVETLGKTTAYGIQTRGTTTITGGTFNVTPKTTTAYGLLVQDGTTTISGTPTFTVRGTTTAYGIYANGATPEDKTGRPYNPNVIVNGGTFDVTTTTGDVAYGVYAGAGTRVITSTASDYYPGIYSSIGTVTVNGGTFNVTAKTYNAIGVYVHRVAAYESGTNTAHVFRGVANIAGGTFTVRDLTHKTTTGACDGVRSYGTLNITGGSFDVAASAATAKNATYVYGVNVYDGIATVSGTPEFTVSAYGTAFGAVANGATPDKATGLPCEADLTIDGGTFNVNTTTSTTAYGVYAAGFAPRVITSTDAGYYPGTYYSKPVATVNGGTFNVKAKTTTAIGAYCGRGVRYDPDVLEPHTIELESFGELNIKGGTFNVSTLGTTTADGVRSFGTTNITGGTFNVTPKTTTAVAIRSYAGKTTITGNPHFTVKGTTTVYGLWAACEAPNLKTGLTYNGEIECNGGTFDLETTTDKTCYGVLADVYSTPIKTLHSTDDAYFAGNYANAGKIVVNDGIFNVTSKTTGAYGVVARKAKTESGNTDFPAATATPQCTINGGKFLVSGTEKYAVYKNATTANFKISGGYWGGDGVNDNLAYYAVSPNKVLTLREAHALYQDGYRYVVGEGGTVTWKNGTTTLLTEVYLKGETPAFTGAAPTKETDAQYTYTFSGWTPAITAMGNSDVTYNAAFNKTPRTYTVILNTNSGTINAGNITEYTYGTGATLPTNVTRTDYDFEGWFDNESLTGEAVTSISSTATGNKEYWAKWTPSETGFYVDIVDVDNSAKTLTLNVTSWPASGWPYTINGEAYGKNSTAGQTKYREDDRTLILSYGDKTPGETFSITATNKSGTTISKHSYIIPTEVKTNTSISSLTANQVIYVKAGATLTVDANTTVQKIYVAPGASLVINSDITLTANTIFLRTTPWLSAELKNYGTLSAQLCYTRIIKDQSQYYQFGLPFDCPLSSVTLSDGTTTAEYGKAWLLRSYSESSRAANGADGNNWVSLTNDATIQGCVGYEMFSAYGYYREFYFPVTPTVNNKVAVSYTADGAAGTTHAGWNIVTSPLTYAYANTGADPVTGLKVSWLQEDGSYVQEVPETIAPAIPLSYQATDNAYLWFDNTPLTQKLSARRRVAEEDHREETEWLHLTIEDVNSRGDQTSIFAHPTRFTEGYEIGIDVAKQSLTASRAILYSSHTYGEMAFAGVSDSLLEQGVALTVYSPAAQELTISLRENEWLNRMESVWLIDKQEGMRLNLLNGYYTFNAPEGTTRGRFFIQGQFKAPNIATELEPVSDSSSNGAKARKVLMGQKMYIIVGEQIYDCTGKLVNK